MDTDTTHLKRASTTRDQMNRPIFTYAATRPSFKANWNDAPAGAREALVSDVEITSSRSRVRFRYRPEVTEADRLVRKTGPSTSVTYVIVGPPVMIGRKKWTEVVAQEFSS